jgi:hypothetical protein
VKGIEVLNLTMRLEQRENKLNAELYTYGKRPW